jgi:aminoglycoside 6'-N-acetyltransferase I
MRLLLDAGAIAGAEAAVFVSAPDDALLDGFIEVSVRRYAEACHGGRVGYIEGWYVAASRRGQGIGARLVRAAEAWAAEQGCLEMASDAETDNRVSERAHLALGYEDVGRLVHFRKALRSGEKLLTGHEAADRAERP